MLFLAKKWIGGLLMPLPLFLLIFFIALILLFFTQKQKMAKVLLLCSFTFILLISFMPVAERLTHRVERKHLPILQKNVAQNFDYILLLGSGGIADPSLPVNSQLSSIANSRFLEALRLFQANPKAILVVSGANLGDVKTHAQMMQELAIIMGIPKQQIIRLDKSLDTDDEAKQMSKLIRGKKSALVTSATHMDRALKLFYKYGTAPMAAPSHFLAKNRSGDIPSYYYIPNAYQLYKTKVAWHEYLGRAQNWVKRLL
ncbi:ElyC/SanA/YdcF family protein [Psychromonas sp. Urea-02u-13]|uniref:ElyC/SanA/YdcF family protein n=1 Tax=Psychromonas sp. Urea-02u-13 TaxID=2058326 RepID=UPI000C347034|nr:ElyC/SanA/YdcF family protein [Psychromonas sp. Urea-02u-13]PKG37604.1 envelope biogenesis factor ElyC [Psychromonas sp. Urea-02u-13]